jgi:hypothetical protein
MTIEDALRKIALLRRVSADKGALAAKRETAYRLQKVLMERYAIRAQEVPDDSTTTAFRLNWGYWRELLEEFGLRLTHFGNRGSAEVGNNLIVYIRLGTNQWWTDERLPSGWRTTVRDREIESLREYLKEHAPKALKSSLRKQNASSIALPIKTN